MSCRGAVRVPEIPNCQCGPHISDCAGRVVRVFTCPACQRIRLDVVRGGVYAGAYVKCGDTVRYVLVKQKDFFSS
jgi:hypothetical protein